MVMQVAVTRTMMTWFLLHNKIHEVHETSGLGNNMYKVSSFADVNAERIDELLVFFACPQL